MQLCLFGLVGPILSAQPEAVPYPAISLSNGPLEVLIFLPDKKHGYYRGQRFDWGGLVAQASLHGTEFFKNWRYDIGRTSTQPHSPLSGTGNSEEFRDPLGYGNEDPDGRFVKIGVGVLKRPAFESTYDFRGDYEIVDHGQWNVSHGEYWAEFEHILETDFGYGYRYSKRIELIPETFTMRVAHRIENSGLLPIQSMTYSHNFLSINHKPVDENYLMEFPAPISASDPMDPLVDIRGCQLGFHAALGESQRVWGTLEVGSSYNVRVSQLTAGASVTISSAEEPLSCFFWAAPQAICPEILIQIQVNPGMSKSWDYAYTFSTTENTVSNQ